MKKISVIGSVLSMCILLAHAPESRASQAYRRAGVKINRDASGSSERIIGGIVRILQSNKLKEKNTKLSLQGLLIIARMMNNAVNAFLKEIEPGDAQKLLPWIDRIGALLQEFISLAEKARNPEEYLIAQDNFLIEAIDLIFQAVRHEPLMSALKKHEIELSNIAATHRIEAVAFLKKAIPGFLNHVRAAFAKKARSAK